MFSSFLRALVVCLWISFATAQPSNGRVLNDVRFFQELNFTGSLHYNQRYNLDSCFNLDLDFYDMTTEPRVSSLITSDCLMVYDIEDCVDSIPMRESNHIRIPPGNYPNLDEFLQKNYFCCTVMSFRACSEKELGLTKPSVTLKTNLQQDHSHYVLMTEICGCQNIPADASVRSLESWNCISLYSEADCQGKLVNIPGGSTAASRNLRVVNFKGLAKSLDLCEGSKPPLCKDHPLPTLSETEVVEEVKITETFNETMSRLENVSCSRTCGGTLYTDKGAILYKLSESLESFERCVWIVRAPSYRSKFEVKLTWSGFTPVVDTQEILVSSYGPERLVFGFGDGLRTQSLNMSKDPMQLVGALLIITLYTDELPIAKEQISRGFILEYSSVEDGPAIPISSFSSDHRIKIGQNLQYPRESEATENLEEVERATYSENEISTFLFLPNDDKESIKTGSKNYFVEMAWSDSLLDDSEQSKREYPEEYVAPYYFRYDGWVIDTEESVGEGTKAFVNDDMILIFFHSKTTGQLYFKSGAQNKSMCPWNLQRL